MRFIMLCNTIVLCLVLSAHGANSKISRSCTSNWEIKFMSASGSQNVVGKTRKFGQFTTRRGCGNSVPNRCRERARQSAQACMDAHWKGRWNRVTPSQCKGDAFSGYRTTDIKRDIERAVCCSQVAPAPNTSKVAVLGRTSGDKQCPGLLNFTNQYAIDCRAVQQREGKSCG